MKTSRKQSKRAASTVRELCKRRMTTGEGMGSIAEEVGGLKEVLRDAIIPKSSINPEDHALAIKTI